MVSILSAQGNEAPFPEAVLADEEIPLVEKLDPYLLERRKEAPWEMMSAERAMALGVYDIAYEFAVRSKGYEVDNVPSSADLGFLAVDALLAQERWIEAESHLDAMPLAPAGQASRVMLRKAMIAYAESDADGVEELLQEISFGTLPVDDVAWYWFLDGWRKLFANQSSAAEESFGKARSVAAGRSPALHAQIAYLIYRSALEKRTWNAQTIGQLQSEFLQNQGREVGFAYAQQLAAMLYDDGQREEAIRLIETQLALVPRELGQLRAQLLLLQSMAAGLERPQGRKAFSTLLFEGGNPELMSIALQQAFSRAREEGGEAQQVLWDVLDQLIAQQKDHILLDQILYYRAVFKFLSEDYVGAEEDAAEFARRYPFSPFKRGVLALQASSAWKRQRYRTAAHYLQEMRSDFEDLAKSSSLSALIADCYFRAGLQSGTIEDYQNAADAYATALGSVELSTQAGPLFFQLVDARIRAGQLERAIDVVDDPNNRLYVPGDMVWRGEWKVVKEMRRLGRVSDAYDRVQSALGREIEDPELRLRLLWQVVKLSYESGEYEDTEYWVSMVNAFVAEEGDEAFKEKQLYDVRASCLLSLADSNFVLRNDEEAVALLERVRREYPESEAALLSYIAQARYFASVDQTVDAQQLLVSLADRYPDNRLAPMALYEAAINAESRGEDVYLDQAKDLLERIVSGYPDSDMVYYARLKQADILRKLNKFGSAERIYEYLENEYADRPDRYLAQMSLAATLNAQANEDPRKLEAAISRWELLMDLPEAPMSLRMEAGYNLGEAWRARGELQKAKDIHWVLYDMMVLERPAKLPYLNRKGRYWLSRCLFSLAEIARQEGKVDESDQFYQQIVDLRLWGAELAKARLGLGGAEGAN